MKNKLQSLLSILTCLIGVHQAFAQGTAFTYQGRLNDGSVPVSGSYDMLFTLYDTNSGGVAIAGPVTNTAVAVTNGLFTTLVGFGPNTFTGMSNWLEIAVSTNGANSFTTLAPRQQLTPVPSAITAENLAVVLENNTIQSGVSMATVSGGSGNNIETGANEATIGGGVNNSIGVNSFIAAIGGGANNSIGTNDDTSTIAGGNSNVIQDGAGVSTIAGGVGNEIQSGSPRSTISGGSNNQIFNNAEHSTIGGGDANQIQNNSFFCTIGGGNQNMIQPNAFLGAIGGGYRNTIQQGADDSTIGGGNGNVIQSNSFESFIGGGQGNAIETNAVWSTVGGGLGNLIEAQFSFIGGGQQNTIQTTNGIYSTIAGGNQNTNSGQFSTIPGGQKNLASGNYSFAAGQQAQSLHQGAFVWADSQDAPFSSTGNDQFLVRAAGGVKFNMNNPHFGASFYVQGSRDGGNFNNSVGFFENTSTTGNEGGSGPALRVVLDGGSGLAGALSVSDNGNGPIAEFGNGIGFVASIANDGTVFSKGLALTSDRIAKENFTALDGKIILAKVISMPVTEWNYKDDAAEKRHIGPVAQDFYTAFQLNGSDDKHISVVDEGGVALAAIQGLNQKLETENAELKQRLAKLEVLVEKLSQGRLK